jgi:hypothetical protein
MQDLLNILTTISYLTQLFNKSLQHLTFLQVVNL